MNGSATFPQWQTVGNYKDITEQQLICVLRNAPHWESSPSNAHRLIALLSPFVIGLAQLLGYLLNQVTYHCLILSRAS